MLSHDRLLRTHWASVCICRIIWCTTCVISLRPSELIVIGSDNGLSPSRRQTLILGNLGILLFGPLAINFNEILSKNYTFSFNKMHLKMSSVKWRPFCSALNMLKVPCYDQYGSLWKSRLSVVNWNYPAAFSIFASQAPRCNDSPFWWLVPPIKQQ